MTTTRATMRTVKAMAAKFGGRVVDDGCGGFEVEAPAVMRWVASETVYLPIPLGEAERKEDRQEMIDGAVSMMADGVETLP